jgi:hypothetical protein
MTYVNTPFMKKVLHITERKRKSNVQHYCKSDDFRASFKVAKWRMFCHSAWLQISPARFKQVLSDLGRVDIKPAPHRLCTASARSVDVLEAAYERSVEREV